MHPDFIAWAELNGISIQSASSLLLRRGLSPFEVYGAPSAEFRRITQEVETELQAEPSCQAVLVLSTDLRSHSVARAIGDAGAGARV
jgi:hypothetical protein